MKMARIIEIFNHDILISIRNHGININIKDYERDQA